MHASTHSPQRRTVDVGCFELSVEHYSERCFPPNGEKVALSKFKSFSVGTATADMSEEWARSREERPAQLTTIEACDIHRVGAIIAFD